MDDQRTNADLAHVCAIPRVTEADFAALRAIEAEIAAARVAAAQIRAKYGLAEETP